MQYGFDHDLVKIDLHMWPIVSCIMPTYNRRVFVAQAIRYFQRQTYSNSELIIIDDGTDIVSDLIGVDPRIKYIRLDGRYSVGSKRNIACEHARGEIIVHWDDDDWHSPNQLSYQVTALLAAEAELCGINKLLFYDLTSGRAWHYAYPQDSPLWLSGSTLCYTRAFWSRHPFPSIYVGEDAHFVFAAQTEHIVILTDWSFHVGIIHDQNISPKYTWNAAWVLSDVEEIKQLLGDDWCFYKTIPRPSTYPKLKQFNSTLNEYHTLAWIGNLEHIFKPYRPTFEIGGFINERHQQLAFCPTTESNFINLGIRGALYREDALILYELAYSASGNILELGCHHGLSTSIIAQAVSDAGARYSVISIDIEKEHVTSAYDILVSCNLEQSVVFYCDDVLEACTNMVQKENPFKLVFINCIYEYSDIQKICYSLDHLLGNGALCLFHVFNLARDFNSLEEIVIMLKLALDANSDAIFQFYGVFGYSVLFYKSIDFLNRYQ